MFPKFLDPYLFVEPFKDIPNRRNRRETIYLENSVSFQKNAQTADGTVLNADCLNKTRSKRGNPYQQSRSTEGEARTVFDDITQIARFRSRIDPRLLHSNAALLKSFQKTAGTLRKKKEEAKEKVIYEERKTVE